MKKEKLSPWAIVNIAAGVYCLATLDKKWSTKEFVVCMIYFTGLYLCLKYKWIS